MSVRKKRSNRAEANKREPERGPSTPLPGWPGYRTREGRSGLDPIDNDIESGHVLGVFLRRFFSMTLRTRHSYQLWLLGIVGFLLLVPFALAVTEALGGAALPAGAWVYLSLIGLVGLIALTNFGKNLLRRTK